jgi:hypothetical protein
MAENAPHARRATRKNPTELASRPLAGAFYSAIRIHSCSFVVRPQPLRVKPRMDTNEHEFRRRQKTLLTPDERHDKLSGAGLQARGTSVLLGHSCSFVVKPQPLRVKPRMNTNSATAENAPHARATRINSAEPASKPLTRAFYSHSCSFVFIRVHSCSFVVRKRLRGPPMIRTTSVRPGVPRAGSREVSPLPFAQRSASHSAKTASAKPARTSTR